MKSILVVLLTLAAFSASAFSLQWTNTSGGDWSKAVNWSPNLVPAPGDAVSITTAGTYVVTMTNTATSIVLSNFTLGGSSGVQTLIIGNGQTSALTVTNAGLVTSTGVLSITNGGMSGNLTVQTGGQLQIPGPANAFLYNLHLVNQGTITWGNTLVETGGTTISNSGLWLITSDANLTYGGGTTLVFTNSGIFRKTAGSGLSSIGPINFLNQPGGLVDAQSGTMQLHGDVTNTFAGTFNASGSAKITYLSGNWTDAGGTTVGTNQFTSGTLNLRTNTVPGLSVLGGDIYIIGTNTFQQAGAITNLTISGSVLHGTNRVAGTLNFTGGSLVDQITVLPTGQLVLGGDGLLYSLKIINQGTVNWTNGNYEVGATPPTVISNGGLWQIAGNNSINFGGVGSAVWTNTGTLRKTAGSGASSIGGFTFANQASGLVQVDSGTLDLPVNVTNFAGTLRLNGGTLQAQTGPIVLAGGTLDGQGVIGAITATGGTISPGQGGAGLMTFASGLNCSNGATISISGSGLAPGTQYDQLAVTGTVSLGNCNLQVTSLPVVPTGTTFVIITNDGTDAVSGTFNGLSENSSIKVGGQPFRIHYGGGSGNDVTLVRDLATALTGTGYSNGTFSLTGTGPGSILYTIQATTNFIQWTNLGTTTSDGAGNFIFNDSQAANFRYRFYRTTN